VYILYFQEARKRARSWGFRKGGRAQREEKEKEYERVRRGCPRRESERR